jgi:hypothetical protein
MKRSLASKCLVLYMLPYTFVLYYDDQEEDGGTVYKLILKMQNLKKKWEEN